jgi:hypothetical protein
MLINQLATKKALSLLALILLEFLLEREELISIMELVELLGMILLRKYLLFKRWQRNKKKMVKVRIVTMIKWRWRTIDDVSSLSSFEKQEEVERCS